MEHHSNNERIKKLVVRYVCGELSEKETDELNRWRTLCSEHEVLFRNVTSMEKLENGILRFVKSPKQVEQEWNQILNRTVRKRHQERRWVWVRYAALFVLPLLLGAIVCLLREPSVQNEVAETVSHQIVPGTSVAELELPDGTKVLLGRDANFSLKEGVRNSGDTLNYVKATSEEKHDVNEVYHTLRIPRGGEYTLLLADGTTVYLNAESELRYPKRFNSKERKVYLTGEGYFDVQRNENRPFIVEAGRVSVNVLGTSFGVRAYEEEQNVLTTLVQGKVKVNAGDGEVLLMPGQQADFGKIGERLHVRQVDVEQYVAWKNGRLVFDNKPLSFILAELGRWYSFDVTYADEKLKEIPYSLNVQKHEDIYHVLRLIERTRKVRFEVNDHIIIVK